MRAAEEWRPDRTDIGLAFMVGAFGVFDSLTSDANNLLGGHRFAAAAVVTAAAVTLCWRRRWPVAVAALSAVAHALANAPVQLMLSLGSAGYHERSGARVAGVTLFAVGLHATALTGETNPSGVRSLLYALISFGGAAVAGALLRRYTDAAACRESALARERERSVVQARSQERARIAREMHDVVAHRVTLIVVEAGALEASAGRGEAWTVSAARRIRATGRTALEELRQIIGVLAPAGRDAAPLAPQPGLGAIGTLVESFRGAAMPVTFAVTGQRRSLPPTAERTTFRVVQEALTNVLKHAGGAQADVRLDFRKDSLAVRVTNTACGGAAGTTAFPAGGAGLEGIKERVALLGGRFTAHGLPDGGFEVSALIPFDEVPWDSRSPSESE
ncbi:histidine kinase [Spirillospora sp. NPDC047279]|uniref:sensor histidine kinase n=1 Tax=Spirillospora sp. NPDC047279 TaxID=3155478 RepID=UPI0033F8F0FD